MDMKKKRSEEEKEAEIFNRGLHRKVVIPSAAEGTIKNCHSRKSAESTLYFLRWSCGAVICTWATDRSRDYVTSKD